MKKRHVFNEQDKLIIDKAKKEITTCIDGLRDEVRYVNIELELVGHIRDELRKGGH